ncbi:MAG: hypothetical protein M3433_02315 [Actinomycetota bacterium]|nr:hypothetical protein [Actinomycetota bacterium]
MREVIKLRQQERRALRLGQIPDVTKELADFGSLVGAVGRLLGRGDVFFL